MGHRRVAARREEILRATLDQIQVRGLNGVRSSDVAGALGVSVGLVHYHFQSLDNLLIEAYRLYVERAETRLRAAISRPGTTLDRLRDVISCYLPHRQSPEWSLWMEAWILSLREPQVAAILRNQDITWRKAVADLIQEGTTAGEFQPTDPEESAWRITSMLDGLGVQLTVHLNTRGRPTLLRWFDAFLKRELGL